ncbi:MAG: carboxypeptidase regulatory-like domain-containing protein [Nitrospira sp.]
MRSVFCSLFALLMGVSSAAWSYEEATVTDGGRLVGTITLAGEIPKPKGYNLVTQPDQVYCGRISDGRGWRLLQPFNVGTGGAFRDVVVYLEGLEKGKSFSHVPASRIEARDCRFIPFTTVVREKQEVVVVNMDPVMHDIQAYETSALGPRVLFNLPLPMNPQHPRDLKDKSDAALYHNHLAGEPMKQLVGMSKGRRVFVMQCGFHAYMESWGLVIENPYFALTDQDGRFDIDDIPPGTYKMVVWHPYIGGIKEQTITIPPKDQARVDVQIPVPTGRLYANQMVEKPYMHYSIPDDVQSQIVPTLIHQRP